MKRSYFFQVLVLVAGLLAFNWNATAQTTFNYTGSVQTYTVPGCVTSITIDAQGARGGHAKHSRGGYGGRVQCTLAVTPGTVLQVYVGGQGDTATPTTGGVGGYNGGGDGIYGYGSYAGGGGGGGSDIRTPPYSLSDRVVAAAGGGGAGYDCTTANTERGGNGGGTTGEHGYDCAGITGPGKGGTPTAGGLGGVYGGWTSGNPGTFGGGGNCDSTGGGTSHSGGGGGGGGWYGGGGGSWGGGGGGSSYAIPAATGVVDSAGYDTSGDGVVIITGCNRIGAITGTIFSLCPAATITVSDTSSVSCGTWISNNPGIAVIGSSTGIITGITAGTTTITYSVPSPCGDTSAIHTITVNPTPAAITGAATVCVGNTTALGDATGFGGWFSTNTAVATVGLTTGVVTGVSIGTATIDYTLLTGCMASVTVTVNCNVGVPQTISPDKYRVDIFPNPVNNELTIQMEDGAYNTCTITNGVGQALMQQTLNAKQTILDVRKLPASIYYITFKGENGTTVRRFVKTE